MIVRNENGQVNTAMMIVVPACDWQRRTGSGNTALQNRPVPAKSSRNRAVCGESCQRDMIQSASKTAATGTEKPANNTDAAESPRR